MIQYIEGSLRGDGKKFGIVVSRFNSFVSEKLLEGALDSLIRSGVLESDIDVARVMDTLRQIAHREGVRPAEKGIVLGYELFLESIKRLGRLYEVGLVAGVNLGTLNPFANVLDVGVPMFLKGKLHLIPGRAGGGGVKRIFANRESQTDADL